MSFNVFNLIFWCDIIHGNLACWATQPMSHLGSNVIIGLQPRATLLPHCDIGCVALHCCHHLYNVYRRNTNKLTPLTVLQLWATIVLMCFTYASVHNINNVLIQNFIFFLKHKNISNITETIASYGSRHWLSKYIIFHPNPFNSLKINY